jgi:hypothetical protein
MLFGIMEPRGYDTRPQLVRVIAGEIRHVASAGCGYVRIDWLSR